MTRPDPPTPLSVELIERPNVLRQKVGGSLSPTLAQVGNQAVAQQMSGEFDGWMADLVGQLGGAYAELQGQPVTPATRDNLYKAALEIKSQGETFGYPLATRIAHSLCRLLIHLQETPAPPALVQAHVQTLQALVRDKVKDPQDKMGTLLAQELENQCHAFQQAR